MITYCTNIHPGESWAEVFSNIRTHLITVKEAVSPDGPFPIGLRLSSRAASELDENALDLFLEWCRDNDCFVPTVNGFPYGLFHGTPIKEKVYIPDWRQKERVEYTCRLTYLLDKLLPEGITGSISTVPVGFGSSMAKEDYPIVKKNLKAVLEYLDLLSQKSGKKILLCLEPEPGCVLETSEEVVLFFEEMDFPEGLKDNLGVCFDCCHHAVEFENPLKSLARLAGSGIALGKIQASSALSLDVFDRQLLLRMDEPNYLHQVVIRRRDGSILCYDDIPDALGRHREEDGDECRIHFHVPIFNDRFGEYGTTRFFLDEVLSVSDRDTLLEIETYTWDVLPPELRNGSIEQSIIREIKYVEAFRAA